MMNKINIKLLKENGLKFIDKNLKYFLVFGTVYNITQILNNQKKLLIYNNIINYQKTNK